MEKSSNKSFENFPATYIYLDDLKEIMITLSDTCERVWLDTGEYKNVKLDEIDDLVDELGKERFEDIYVKAFDPYISVDLRPFNIRVYIAEDNILERGVVEKIREIVNRNRRKFFGEAIKWLAGVPAIAAGVALVEGEFELGWVMMALTLLMTYPVVKYQMTNKVIVLTKNKENRAPFVKRNKDELLVALVSATAGAIISFVLIKYFGQA
ncbi:MAG: hypothetical protein JAY84_00820 [Candidatus Thiodiazotropha taylori]|nr:hypothetical protein [Candidatus Thiodiazotropha taylori]